MANNTQHVTGPVVSEQPKNVAFLCAAAIEAKIAVHGRTLQKHRFLKSESILWAVTAAQRQGTFIKNYNYESNCLHWMEGNHQMRIASNN